MAARLKERYQKEVRKKVQDEFGIKNTMAIPKIDKVVINMGIGEAVNDRKKVELAAADLALIAGQKPIVTFSRKAIATYKLREGQAIGPFLDQLHDVRHFELQEELDRRVLQLELAHIDEHLVARLADLDYVIGVRWRR